MCQELWESIDGDEVFQIVNIQEFLSQNRNNCEHKDKLVFILVKDCGLVG